jgi:hypothetical protein
MPTPLLEFQQFVNSTPFVYVTSPDEFLNEAVFRMPILGRLLRGRAASVVLQGGQKIRDIIKLNVPITGGHFLPNEPIEYQIAENGVLHEVEWRFHREHMGYVESVIALNMVAGLSPDSRRTFYKRLLFSIEQDLWTKIYNGLENDTLADPANDAASTEGTGGRRPLPLYAIVNEYDNGLPPGWTTVAGVDPTANEGWVPIRKRYDYTDAADEDNDNDGLLDAFEQTYQELQWQPIADGPAAQKYFQKSGMDPARRFIAASAEGLTLYHRQLQERNDTLNRWGDPHFGQPKYADVEVVQVSQMGKVKWYAGSGGNTTETSATVTTKGPRYLWLDGNYLKPIFHVTRYFEMTEWMRLQNQPDTMVRNVFTYWNLFPCSRQRLAIVAPGA